MKIEETDDVALLRLDVGKANAIGVAFLNGVNGLLDQVDGSDARSLVLTGYDKYFSAGLALPELIGYSRDEHLSFLELFSETMLRVYAQKRPVIAAINGHAVAGGCVLALQTDLRVMADGPTKIGLNEVQIGLALPPVVIETLRAQVPASSLMPIALRGKLFSPKEAETLGLVDEVVDQGRVESRAIDHAQALGALSPSAFSQIKLALRQPVIDAVKRDQALIVNWVDNWFTEATQKTLRAVVEKITAKKQ